MEKLNRYDLSDAEKILKIISSEQFKKFSEFYNKFVGDYDSKLNAIIEAKRENIDKKYKTVEELKKYLLSQKKTLEKQNKIIVLLSERNQRLSKFIIDNSLNDKITKEDLIEISDGYSEKFDELLKTLDEEYKKLQEEKLDIENAVKMLNEPRDVFYEEPFDGDMPY